MSDQKTLAEILELPIGKDVQPMQMCLKCKNLPGHSTVFCPTCGDKFVRNSTITWRNLLSTKWTNRGIHHYLIQLFEIVCKNYGIDLNCRREKSSSGYPGAIIISDILLEEIPDFDASLS